MDYYLPVIALLFAFAPTEAAVGDSCTTASTCGQYNGWKCEGGFCACNTAGYSGDQCVPKIPTVKMPQSSYTANLGSSVTITCQVTDTAEVNNVVWTHYSYGAINNVNVSNGRYSGGTPSTPSLTILSVEAGDAGSYWCRAANPSGIGYSATNTTITVTSPISVSLTGQTRNVAPGSSVTLTATITSAASVTSVVWQKVSSSGSIADITIDSTKYTQTGSLGSGTFTITLTINNVAYSDEASYQIRVTNSLGTEKTSDALSLTVAGDKPIVSISGLSQSGTSLTITCTATVTSGSPAITTIQWKKDGTVLNIPGTNTKYLGGSVATPSLTISNVNNTDRGGYQCVATNSKGSTGSNTITLVTASVTISGSSTVVYGSDITFTGIITSTPAAQSVKWQKVSGGQTSDIDIINQKYSGSSVAVDSPKLVINYAVSSDEATYHLVVINLIGSTTSDGITLDVTGIKPSVTISSPTQSDTSVTITCTGTITPDSPPISAIQWKKDGTVLSIPGTNNKYSGGSVATPSLTINNIDTADKGSYQCVVTNGVGSATSSTVTLAPPTVQVTGTGSVLYGSSVTFTATITSILPSHPQKWQKIYGNGIVTDVNINESRYAGSTLTSSNPKLVIAQTDFTDKAKYQLVVTNGVGDTTSNQVDLDVTGDVPTVTIVGLSTVVYGSNITFTGTITSRPAAQSVKWQKVSGGQTSDIDINSQKYSGSSVAVGSSKLIINNAVSPSDEATYQLIVTNPVGTKISNGIILDVTGSIPTISITSHSAQVISVVYGTSVTLNAMVTTTSDSPPVLPGTGAWQKQINGVFTNINLSETKYQGSSNDVTKPSLMIKNAIYTDEVAYRFTARNLVGLAVSVAKTLNITGTHVNLSRVKRQAANTSAASQSSDFSSINTTRTVTKPTVSLTADPSNTVQFGFTLRITAFVSANPSPTFAVWQRKNPSSDKWADIDINNSKYNGSSVTPNVPVLVIASITYDEDQTSFRCVVGNAEGNTSSTGLIIDVTGNLVTVSVSPVGPIQVPYNTSMMTALVTSITAEANTQPAQEVRWRKIPINGIATTININKIKYTGSSLLPSPRLVINNAVFGDEAEYQCQARNTEGWGSSNKVKIDVTGGNLTVTTGSDQTAKIGESITIACTVIGPEISSVTWKKGDSDLSVDGNKYTGSNKDTPPLTINNLVMQDADQYQCAATNPGGTYSSMNKATLSIIYRQFQDYCNGSLQCDNNKKLKCSQSTNLCVCLDTHYHKEKICYLRDRLKVSISSHSSSTSAFMVSWNPPTDSSLVTNYKVKWRVHNQPESSQQSNTVDKLQTSHSVSSGLIPGQLYIITVSTVVNLVNPNSTVEEDSDPEYIRIVPLPPGSLIVNQSNLAANNLQLTWNRPENNTFVSKYSVTINGATESTTNDNPNIHFSRQLIPGEHYSVSIVTISGKNSNNDEQKTSSAHVEQIRTTPTKPGPPTSVKCPSIPKDKSLQISWTAPTNPNGQIQRYIINVYLDSQLIKTVDTMENISTFDVDGLSEGTSYAFKVQTVNDAVDSKSDESVQKICKTVAGLSSAPTNLGNEPPASRGVQISFSRPNDVKGVLAGYRIIINDDQNICQQEIQVICTSCREIGFSARNCIKKETSRVTEINATQTYEVGDLNPYTTYTVKVAAGNRQGEGNFAEKTFKTDEEVPQKPSVSKVTAKSDTEVDLGWMLASPLPGNVTYTVTVLEAEDNTSDIYMKKMEPQYYGFLNREEVISGLEEFWRYKFTVKAATIKGSQTSEESSVIRTNQGAPGKVRSFSVQRKSNSYKSAVLRWKVPFLIDQNGILVNYKFINNGTESLLPVSFDESSITEKEIAVVPEMTYIIEVYAINSENTNGDKEKADYYAPPGTPPKPTDTELVLTRPGQHQPTQTTVQIRINTDFFTNKDNGEPVYFGITVCADCNNVNANADKNYFETLPNWFTARSNRFPLYRVTNESYMENVKNSISGRRKRSTEVPYVIGEDNTCESQGSKAYCNGPLSPGKAYKVVVFSCTNGGCVQTRDIGPFATAAAAVPESEFPVGAVVGGVTAATAVFIIVVVAVIIYIRRRKDQNDDHTYADLELNERIKSEQVYQKLDRNTSILKEKAIPVHQFVSHVEDMMKDSKLKIYHEFSNLLLSAGKGSTRVGHSKTNAQRNRSSIVPYDFNRVKLLDERKGSKNDYINASFILDQHYIMTQYPLPGTFGHFWQMVWEQNASAVVVLSDDTADNNKDEWYFPVIEGAVHSTGGIDVELLATFNMLDKATMRKIRLSKGKQFKNVNHYHVYGLKMANLSSELLNCTSLVKSNKVDTTGTGSFIVHGGCSGTDYSGVFIPIDYLIKVMESGARSVDVYGTALRVMNERTLTISTEEQYSVIYTCLQKYLQTKVDAKNFDEKFKNTADTYEYLP